MSKEPVGRPVAIEIGPSTTIHNLRISNNTVRGGDLLRAEGATIHDLSITLNKVYGGQHPVKLGNVFGAEIAGNLFDMEVPEKFLAELKDAAKSSEAKKTFLEKIKQLAMDPAQIVAMTELVDKVRRLAGL